MSIYRRPKIVSEHDIAAPVAPAGDSPHDTRAAQVAESIAQMRKSSPVDIILPAGRKWLESLPGDVRPGRLAAQFPRIVNLLALDWNKQTAIGELFDELLIDRRGDRAGFPLEVLRELRALSAYRYRRIDLDK